MNLYLHETQLYNHYMSASKHNDTSWLGHKVRASYNELVSLFGEPHDINDGKMFWKWCVFNAAGEAVTIYDWYHGRDARQSSDEQCNWNIGASTFEASEKFKNELNAMIRKIAA